MRGWPAWFGLWAAGAVGLMCALASPEALSLSPHTPREPDQVTATDASIVAVPWLAGLLLPVLVGLVLWWRRPGVVRGCLLLCAAGLVGAAVTVRGIPDTGPWQPWVVAGAALVALLGAALGPGAEHVGPTGRWVADRWWTAAPVLLILLASATVALVWAGSWMLSVPMLDRHEESESGWSKLPELVVGTGLLAAAVALVRRWWSTAAMSVLLGCILGASVVAGNDDQWRLLW